MAARYTSLCICFLLISTLASACFAPLPTASDRTPAWEVGNLNGGDEGISISVVRHALTIPKKACEDRFVARPLHHVTAISGDVVRMFDSNGAGLAVNDLDNDGDLDIVLGNLAGPNAVFWNEGGLSFHKQAFDHGQTRGVTIVDIDGDGWQDIVFARRGLRPTIWMNRGIDSEDEWPDLSSRFAKPDWVDLAQRANVIAWADLDADNDLDAVVATYQTEYTREDAADMAGGGVVYYENEDGRFKATYLADRAQALSLLLVDLNDDGRLDIWVGNDFLMPDYVWLWSPAGWRETQPFSETAENTMSADAADIDNDGIVELFAADMKPFAQDPETLAAWAPLVEKMQPMDDDNQVIENVLLARISEGRFENRAESAGVEASGWSWSSKFGDLDNDGFQDLYVVNGMAAEEMFSHLPENELVEENLVFRNMGDATFEPVPDWQLGGADGGRSMNMADLDEDGDLDIVINNLLAPALIFENRLCGGGALEVDLFWPGSMNTRAIGARVLLHTDTGTYLRDIRSASGYLSGDPARIHIGLPADSQPERLEVIWPDGETSTIEDVQPNSLYTVERRH